MAVISLDWLSRSANGVRSICAGFMRQMFTRETAFPLAAVTHPTGRITGRTQVRHVPTEETSVWNWRLPLPDGSLNRTRLGAVVIAGIGVVSQLGGLGNPL